MSLTALSLTQEFRPLYKSHLLPALVSIHFFIYTSKYTFLMAPHQLKIIISIIFYPDDLMSVPSRTRLIPLPLHFPHTQSSGSKFLLSPSLTLHSHILHPVHHRLRAAYPSKIIGRRQTVSPRTSNSGDSIWCAPGPSLP